MKWETVAEKILEKERCAVRRNLGKIPYTAEKGVFDDKTSDISWWTNGFWAGLNWQLYGAFGGETFRSAAEAVEQELDRSLMDAQGMDHDSGFKWLLTAGANFALTDSGASKNRLLLAANDLAGRFNPAGNFIRAWNDKGDGETAGWAIIDCMMNLPLLYRASELTNDPRYRLIAMRHADTARAAFLRADGSVCHIVCFDPVTGARLNSLGGQGYGHGSAWTRGQAWAVYGFTLSYLHTKKEDYLAAAEKAATYFISHIPESGLIPADFCQPPSPAYEDSSAAAIASCGFLELSRATGNEVYRAAAKRLLFALTEKRCNFGGDSDPLLENCSVAYRGPNGIPLIYADYFYTEAILKLIGKETFLW